MINKIRTVDIKYIKNLKESNTVPYRLNLTVYQHKKFIVVVRKIIYIKNNVISYQNNTVPNPRNFVSSVSLVDFSTYDIYIAKSLKGK